MKKYFILAISLFAGLTNISVTSALAQTNRPTVFLEATDEFANEFSAEAIRKGVPIAFTTDRQQAGYVAGLTWERHKGSKTRGVLTLLIVGAYVSGAYERVSLSVMERKSKNVIYRYTCLKVGPRMQLLAGCLTRHWKNSFNRGKSQMREFTAAELEAIEEVEATPIQHEKPGDAVPTQMSFRVRQADVARYAASQHPADRGV